MNDTAMRVIYRFDEPTKLDVVGYLTVCQVSCKSDKPESNKYFLQVSKDSDFPKWEPLGTLSLDLIIKLIDLLK